MQAKNLSSRRILDLTLTPVTRVLGVVLLIGNVTVTAYWKVLADRTRSAILAAHAQRAVIYADWLFTLPGIVLILAGG